MAHQVLSFLEKEKETLLSEYQDLKKRTKSLVKLYFQIVVSLMLLNGGATFYQGAFPMCDGGFRLSMYMSIAFFPGFLIITYIIFGKWRELNVSVEAFKDTENIFVEDLREFLDPGNEAVDDVQGAPADPGNEAVDDVQGAPADPGIEPNEAVDDDDVLLEVDINEEARLQHRRYNLRVRCLRRVPWNSDKFGWRGRYSCLMYWIVIVGVAQTFGLPLVIHYFLCRRK